MRLPLGIKTFCEERRPHEHGARYYGTLENGCSFSYFLPDSDAMRLIILTCISCGNRFPTRDPEYAWCPKCEFPSELCFHRINAAEDQRMTAQHAERERFLLEHLKPEAEPND